jgi:hypothetical protein
METYQHATKNELDTFLLRAGNVQNILDVDGNPVDITRKHEFTGAGIEYCTSFVEYLCTHFNDVDYGKDDNYFAGPKTKWGIFLDIVSGGEPGQRKRIERAILNLHASPKPTLIRTKDGKNLSMIPFNTVVEWEDGKDIKPEMAAKLARLNKREGADLLPIKYITVYFSRPLFETFFDKRHGRYTFPPGMYAKMWKHANNIQKAIDKGIQPKEETNIDTEANISAYCRFARYIIRHHNLTGKQMKDPNTVGKLNIDILDMLEEVYPSAIRLSHGERIIDEKVWQRFLQRFFPMILIAGFDIYPVCESPIYEKNGKKILPLNIYTTLEKALKAIDTAR